MLLRPFFFQLRQRAMRKLLFLTLVGAVIGIGFLHFFTPGSLVLFHDTYRRLSYFPIVLGAIWFGLPGGITLAVLASIAFIPHLLLYIGSNPQLYVSELTEIVLYLAAGTVTGVIAGREARLREKYKQLSEKLEKSYARLHRETELLIETEERLAASQKLSALGQLSASLAHEIKNPLSSIKGTAEILLDDYPADHPKREFVEILMKEAARLNATVEDVLRFSRGQRGKEEPTEPLLQVIDRVGKLLDSRIRKKSIRFSLAQDDGAGNFYVEGGKIAQVFLNIILNAIDAVPTGGTVRVEVRKERAGWATTVCDSGPGIPFSERERIFEPFVSDKEEGTGLGLLISRRIVESYGGRITVSDADEGGACFTVFLPEGRDHSLPDAVTGSTS